MSYIGNPIVSTDFPVNYFSGNGSTTAFTLSIAPASVNAIDVQISGVSQSPQTYSVSGTTLTFSAAPPTGSSNIVVRHLGVAGIPNTPSAGSVVPSSIGTGYSLWNLSGSDVNYTAGNVGIGTGSPSQKLHVVATTTQQGILVSGSVDNVALNLTNSGTSGKTWGIYSANSNSGAGGGSLAFFDGTAYRAIIDTNGNLLVGTTVNTATNTKLSVSYDGNSVNGCGLIDSTGTTAGTRYSLFFQRGTGTTVGSISTTTSTTSFNTSSDYRLKENIAPMQNALNVVQQLKPVTYTWKSDGSDGQGFIAHELQAVVPDCVTGEKDAVDAEGNPQYQGIDTSFLVATLTAAIQEQQAQLTSMSLTLANANEMIEELKTKVAALEAK